MSERVEQLAEQLSALKPSVAGELADALCRALGIRLPQPVIQRPPEKKPPEPTKTEFDVILDGFDESRKVAVIRLVREIKGLGLIESKTFVEQFPSVIAQEVTESQAASLKEKFEAAGGKVLVK